MSMSGGLGGGGTECTICQKVTFPAETVSYEKKPYHIECFRCQETVDEGECGKKLEASSCAGYEGKIYCKQCFDRGGYTQKQRNVKWTPRGSVSGPASTKSKFGGGGTPCEICAKTVYPAESLSYEKKVYHQDCFKCTTCTKKLTGSNAALFENCVYCKRCFADGGFAQKQRNVKWEKKESSGGPVDSKFGGGGVPCHICEKRVYTAEMVSFDKKCYHAECFKCKTCSKKMTPSGAACYEDDMYCKKCFADGGFTSKQRNVKWEAKESSGPASRFNLGGGGTKCAVCAKIVYPAETVSYEKKAYHQDCFKCSECDKKVTPSSCGKYEDDGVEKLFCTQCFSRGGYAKKQAQIKKSDTGTPKTYDNRFAKFGGGGKKCVICVKTVYPAELLSFEKNDFHVACFKCSHEGCSKGGKPITVSDAQYQKHSDGTITVFCSKCFGELGLNRA